MAETNVNINNSNDKDIQPEKPSHISSSPDITVGTPPSSSQNATAQRNVNAIEKPASAGLSVNSTQQTKRSADPEWPEIGADHPLSQLAKQVPAILKEADYNEVFGVHLQEDAPFHTKLILQKFLRANANDVPKAREQLLKTLKWRKEFQPLSTLQEPFDRKRFEGLGYVVVLEKASKEDSNISKQVVTFNIYGAVKDNKATFEDLNGFLRWRVALMELGLRQSYLNLKNASKPIPDYNCGPDPYQGIQVHDYLSVSFLRMDPYAKAASKKTIEIFQQYYPEMLSRKFFVNVPVIMGWMFNAMKLVLAKETVKKFTVLSYGQQLAIELDENVPTEYGGNGGQLKDVGIQLHYKN